MIVDYKEEVINIKKKNNETIHCVYNYVDDKRPLIIIPPQYEKTIRTNLLPMLYLINNGFNTFRYDNTHHKGNSTGEFVDFTFDSAYDDICEVMDYVKSNASIITKNGMGILGFSIVSRIVIRYLAYKNTSINMLLSIVGVIDMNYTLNAILGTNPIQAKIEDPTIKLGIQKVLKYPINWDTFVDAIIKSRFHNLEETKKEIDKISIPIYLILGEKDSWINLEDYNYVFSDNKKILRETYKLPNTSHELYKNPQGAEHTFYAMVDIFRSFWNMEKTEESELVKPTVVEVISLNRKEREREFKYANL